MLELGLKRPRQPLTAAWSELPIAPRGSTDLGVSFRPRQVEAFGLDEPAALQTLLRYPFDLIRLGAYWNRIEPRRGTFETGQLDNQLDAAERAGKRVILAVGAVKTFGYPELFIPSHYLEKPLRERTLIKPADYPELVAGATDFIARVVARYRNRQSIVAWQLEHEAVDPLGVEHSWRLAEAFVERELQALREADASRPVMMNGFLPTSSLVQLTQWWRTRDQGDSLDLAVRLADIVGVDYYPRHALRHLGPRTLYLESADFPWERSRRNRLFASAAALGKRLVVSEGQAEPWEAVTVPPSPQGEASHSCPPEDLIRNYNTAMAWSASGLPLDAYLFWGAEYWLLRDGDGDPSYLKTFGRILDQA